MNNIQSTMSGVPAGSTPVCFQGTYYASLHTNTYCKACVWAGVCGDAHNMFHLQK